MAIGILLFMMAIFFLGSKKNILQKYYRLTCYFDKVNGLRVGAPVQLAGINVGYIDAIAFQDLEDAFLNEELTDNPEALRQKPESQTKKILVKVKVVMKIDAFFQDRIRSDSVASIQTQGLLGDRMIFISVGTQEGTPLSDGQIIKKIVDPSGFNQLVFEGNDLILKAKSFLDNSSGFVSNTNNLVSKLNSVMGEVIEGEGLVHEVIYEKKHKNTLANLDEILRNFNVASQQIASVTGKINNGTGTLGSLVNDDSLYRDLKMLFGKANRNKLIRSIIRYTLQTKDKEHLK